ncbi:hypothetical protein [Thaumasiovibrio subtropicus]|uniref:hypothetical protein n=1 Tax=Thaumasiovibrio subtropicus TaxID=1891207 RepID=UPI00131DAD17|nr:hypothetical protein [Thaumasiovibrio subtropicus]
MSKIHLVLQLDEALKKKAEQVAKFRGFTNTNAYLKSLLEDDIHRIESVKREEKLKM